MRDEIVLETAQQIKALGNPLRQRILGLVTDAPCTNKQLATALDISPPRTHFHVRELLEAGLIEIVLERPKGGVIEKYYRAVARVIRLSQQARQFSGKDQLMQSSLEAIQQEFMHASQYFQGELPEFKFTNEPMRISQERLDRIKTHLQGLTKEVYEALEDPQRDHYPHFVSLTYLLHSLPPVPVDEAGGQE